MYFEKDDINKLVTDRNKISSKLIKDNAQLSEMQTMYNNFKHECNLLEYFNG